MIDAVLGIFNEGGVFVEAVLFQYLVLSNINTNVNATDKLNAAMLLTSINVPKHSSLV